MEDLHWVDPSTLEPQLARRSRPHRPHPGAVDLSPDFSPPWTGRAHLSQVTLPRLPRQQATEMTDRVAHGKTLPSAVVEQIVAKTDGVPLFVEELTKMVLESGLLQEREDHYDLTGPLPPGDSGHAARLADGLPRPPGDGEGAGATRGHAGREFSYALLAGCGPVGRGDRATGLHQLVEAEFLYQRGLRHRRRISSSMPSSRRRRTVAASQARASSTTSVSPRWWRRSFPTPPRPSPSCWRITTRRGLQEQAISYWQRAGQQALQRSASLEAVQHLTMGLGLLALLPETLTRPQELDLQTLLGPAPMAIKGHGAPEVEQTYARARVLRHQVAETPHLFSVPRGLCRFYQGRGALQTAQGLGEQLTDPRAACGYAPASSGGP